MFRVVARAVLESPTTSTTSALLLVSGRLQPLSHQQAGYRVTSERDEYGYHVTSEARSEADGDGVGDEIVHQETGVREKSKFLPPQGRELLAAVKLGIPGAQEEFERQQALLQKRMNTRRKFSEFNRSDGQRFDGFNLDKRKLFAAKDPRGYYKILNLEGQEGSATIAEIKAAFKKRAKELHPDVSEEEETAETFRYLVKAYNVLKDPQQRAFYDGASMY